MVGKGLRLSVKTATDGAQRIRGGDQPDMIGIAADGRAARGQDTDGRCIAVIGVVGRDDARLACHRLRHAQGNIIRLGPCADHDGLRDSVIQLGGQPFDIVQHRVMQIACMGVERSSLRGNGLDHARVTMADMRHVVVAIQIAVSLFVPNPDTLPAHQMQRRFIKGGDIRSHQPDASGQHVFAHQSPARFKPDRAGRMGLHCPPE